jgi:ribonuclease HI
MLQDRMPWLPHRLRDADVWAKVDTTGALVTDREGRVDIVYKPNDGARVYRAGARNLVARGGAPIEIAVGEPAPARDTAPSASGAAIQVWTDGACTGNPGPAGLGVVVLDGKKREELSEFLGQGTNNIAELSAILRGLEQIADRKRPVVVYTDSQYAIGVLTLGHKAKANVELIERLRALCRQFADLRFVKVAGHSGIPLNERTDELARTAITRGR